MKNVLILILILSLPLITMAQQLNAPEDGLVKWMSLKEAQDAYKIKPKPVIIDVYTNWCGWCKHMMKTTYSNPVLAEYINYNFYPVKFNAETKDTIEFLGEKFVNKGSGVRSAHDLAVKLLNGRMSYPTTLFMSNNFKFSLSAAGYLDIQKIEPLLVFTLENVYMTCKAEEFQKRYKQAFYDTSEVKRFPVKWVSMQEALEQNKKDGKKIFVNLYSDYCNSCRVMLRTTYTDSTVATTLNDNFHAVNFNIASLDTVEWNGKRYGFVQNINNLSYALTGNSFYLPSVSFISNEGYLITNVPYYMTPDNLMPVLQYFASDSYLTVKWEDYLKLYQQKKQPSE